MTACGDTPGLDLTPANYTPIIPVAVQESGRNSPTREVCSALKEGENKEVKLPLFNAFNPLV